MKRRGFLGSLCGLAAAILLPRRFLLPQTREQFMGVVANYNGKRHGTDWAAINKTATGYRVVEMDFISSDLLGSFVAAIRSFMEKYDLCEAWVVSIDCQPWGPTFYRSKALASRPEDAEILLMFSEMQFEMEGISEHKRPRLRAMWREVWKLYLPGLSLRYPERTNAEREIFKRYGQYEGGW